MRGRILDAALEVFAQSGYRSGALREIAARVDMSEAGPLHHFPSKVAPRGAPRLLRERDRFVRRARGIAIGRRSRETILLTDHVREEVGEGPAIAGCRPAKVAGGDVTHNLVGATHGLQVESTVIHDPSVAGGRADWGDLGILG